MRAKPIPFSKANLRQLFDYVNNHLVWRTRPSNCSYQIGKVAGCVHRTGYRIIKLNNLIYPAHRLIWVYHYGWIDVESDIDHINGIKDDNRLCNLRLVTRQENCFNRSLLNSKGYSWNKNTKVFQSSITVDGKLRYLGSFFKEADARLAYTTAVEKYHIIKDRICQDLN